MDTREPGLGYDTRSTPAGAPPPNGPGAAAVLGTGIGVAALGVFALAGDALPPVARLFDIYHPTGPLSGVTSGAIAVWLLSWLGLHLLWRDRSVRLGPVVAAAAIGFAVGLVLTFPPAMDAIQGR
ncbi:hypothetical protein [Acidisphaera rubrifaciens]|uniref:Uncharacterized protein n=1 Tax=Acidisphaera rubrifaciens HS-AP3 TaxID=1231350 RepID=A0A0D6P5P9_9PROT|nr:hypothetical protein [Acidisphaera rubrifaciens]GAN76646.1 hypothetical protein Asru_0137_07 [Acidisphaera rubrifaciens HS-AP3]